MVATCQSNCCHYTQSVVDSNVWVTLAFVTRIGLPESVYAVITYYMQHLSPTEDLENVVVGPASLSTGKLESRLTRMFRLGRLAADFHAVHKAIRYLTMWAELMQKRSGIICQASLISSLLSGRVWPPILRDTMIEAMIEESLGSCRGRGRR
ncbi:hypothetical protein K440DRAFT_363123 [Wilcoxina mikolae CBS 423.85]|nr:hypothetical protein K440DRAFT_363123 [Wilcoxina mikolae CBS 423.85]